MLIDHHRPSLVVVFVVLVYFCNYARSRVIMVGIIMRLCITLKVVNNGQWAMKQAINEQLHTMCVCGAVFDLWADDNFVFKCVQLPVNEMAMANTAACVWMNSKFRKIKWSDSKSQNSCTKWSVDGAARSIGILCATSGSEERSWGIRFCALWPQSKYQNGDCARHSSEPRQFGLDKMASTHWWSSWRRHNSKCSRQESGFRRGTRPDEMRTFALEEFRRCKRW